MKTGETLMLNPYIGIMIKRNEGENSNAKLYMTCLPMSNLHGHFYALRR